MSKKTCFVTSELFSSWGADCPAIVTAEEDHWCFHNSCKVERCMEVSLNNFYLSGGLDIMVLASN
jgi:hypothetical protein